MDSLYKLLLNKIKAIRTNLSAANKDLDSANPFSADVVYEGPSLNAFTPASIEEIRKIIMKASQVNAVNLILSQHL